MDVNGGQLLKCNTKRHICEVVILSKQRTLTLYLCEVLERRIPKLVLSEEPTAGQSQQPGISMRSRSFGVLDVPPINVVLSGTTLAWCLLFYTPPGSARSASFHFS
jgi:hypothetical protein